VLLVLDNTMLTMRFASLAGLIVCAGAATLKVGDFAQGAEFNKCMKITDFNTKTLGDAVEVTDKVDGCCPEGYIPGIKHYNNYWGSMVVCGFKDDGSVAMSSKTSNSVKTCEYNKCYVVKMDITCKDSSKMTLDGCCPKDQYTDDCKHYVKSQSFFKEKVGYCLSYQKKYKLEGTSDKTDDQVTVDGVTSLSLTNLKAYTVCPGGWGSSSAGYELVGDAACVDAAGSHGAGALKFSKSTDKSSPHTNCQAACSVDATCTGYDSRAAGCLYYKIKIVGSNKASTAYKCYRKATCGGTSPAPAPATGGTVNCPSIGSASTTSVKFGDMEQGASFNKCIAICDFNSKTLSESVRVTDRMEGGCCPQGFIPGAKYYAKYQGAQVVCGFKSDGTVALSTGSSSGSKTCTYNGCYVQKQNLPCSDDSRQLINGCCGKTKGSRTFQSACKSYDYTLNNVYNQRYEYCLSYDKDYGTKGWVGTAESTDDIKDGRLHTGNLYTYTPCEGSSVGGGSSSNEETSSAVQTTLGTLGVIATCERTCVSTFSKLLALL